MKIFKIHPLTTEDIQKQETREKCEILNHYTFISFRSFTHAIDDVYGIQSAVFYILVFSDGVLSVRYHFCLYVTLTSYDSFDFKTYLTQTMCEKEFIG